MPPFEDRLAVHGYIAIGDTFSVTVGQTVRDNRSGTQTYLSNALVQLYAQGVLLDTLRYDSASKYYISKKVRAEAGKPYTIKVEAKGFRSVEATATGISAPVTESIKHIKKARTSQYGNVLDDVFFSFHDPAGVKNYYLVQVHSSDYYNYLGCVYSTDPAIEQPKGSALPFDDGDCIDPKFIFFTDESFEGQLKEISLSGYTSGLTPHNVPGDRLYKPYIKRYAISKQFYDYYKFTSAIHDRDELPFVTEMASNKGNIVNGYGIFTIFGVVTDTLP
jgi:hypothetical protein